MVKHDQIAGVLMVVESADGERPEIYLQVKQDPGIYENGEVVWMKVWQISNEELAASHKKQDL